VPLIERLEQSLDLKIKNQEKLRQKEKQEKTEERKLMETIAKERRQSSMAPAAQAKETQRKKANKGTDVNAIMFG